MKHYITPEEHARMQRRRGRQALGLLVAILVIVGFVTVLRAGVGAVAAYLHIILYFPAQAFPYP